MHTSMRFKIRLVERFSTRGPVNFRLEIGAGAGKLRRVSAALVVELLFRNSVTSLCATVIESVWKLSIVDATAPDSLSFCVSTSN